MGVNLSLSLSHHLCLGENVCLVALPGARPQPSDGWYHKGERTKNFIRTSVAAAAAASAAAITATTEQHRTEPRVWEDGKRDEQSGGSHQRPSPFHSGAPARSVHSPSVEGNLVAATFWTTLAESRPALTCNAARWRRRWCYRGARSGGDCCCFFSVHCCKQAPVRKYSAHSFPSSFLKSSSSISWYSGFFAFVRTV